MNGCNDNLILSIERNIEFYISGINKLEQSSAFLPNQELDDHINELERKVNLNSNKTNIDYSIYLLYILAFVLGILFTKLIKG